MKGPYYADQGLVHDHEGTVVLITGADVPASWAERVAADLNLADSITAEKNIDLTLALHRRDSGETIRMSVELCSQLCPREMHEAIAWVQRQKSSNLRLIAVKEPK